MDNEDHQFLQSQPTSFNLTAEYVEKYMEFLENNSKMQVPTFDQFKSSFYTHRPLQALEKVYDYWLDKRLKLNGKQLMCTHKSFENSVKKGKKLDPYVAFRPCSEKIFLRKNRKVQRFNYLKMLQIRATMLDNVKKCREDLLKKRLQHEILKKKYEKFENAYQMRYYNELPNNQRSYIDPDLLMNYNGKQINDNEEKSVDNSKEMSLDSLRKLEFHRKAGSQFHAVRKIKCIYANFIN